MEKTQKEEKEEKESENMYMKKINQCMELKGDSIKIEKERIIYKGKYQSNFFPYVKKIINIAHVNGNYKKIILPKIPTLLYTGLVCQVV